MPSFIIDAPHHYRSVGQVKSQLTEKPNADAIIKLLNQQPETSASYGGAYREDTSLCQIIVVTPMSENQLDDLLYRTDKIDYIGTSMFSAD